MNIYTSPAAEITSAGKGVSFLEKVMGFSQKVVRFLPKSAAKMELHIYTVCREHEHPLPTVRTERPCFGG
jgi:hypothetical protein